MSMRASLAPVPCCLAVMMSATAFAQGLPTLRYNPPANFSRSGSNFPEDYSSQEVSAGIQVYPFRAFRGDFQQAFRQSLLRELIDAQFRETNVASQPVIGPANIPGAEAGLLVRFYENIAGLPKPHLRVALLAKGAVAIVDLSANSDASFQRAWPAMQATMISLKVAAPNAVASGPPPGTPEARAAASAVSGLFMGTKPKYMVDLQRGVGYGRTVVASHWYLFSGDGRVHRGYDDPVVPGGDVRRFDFETARRADPDNSGTYTTSGNQLVMDMGTQGTEHIAVPFEKNRVVISTVIYYKKEP